MPESKDGAILEAEGLTKRFGGFHALHELDTRINRGDIHAVIGPNGAGKTTFFNLLTGALPADAGEIRFEGQSLGSFKPHKRTLLGIARTFQNNRLFGHMTALDNVMLGRHCRSYHSMWQSFRDAVLHRPFGVAGEERQMRDHAAGLLEFVGLIDQQDAKAADLPYGEQRLLELARALATEPRLLLLDEPAAGMNPRETEELDELITRVRDRGVTVILVEHDMNLVMGISDRVTVLNFGNKIAEGTPSEIQDDPVVIEAYLGGKEVL